MSTLLVVLLINFLPFVVACVRRHNDVLAIFCTIVLVNIGTVVAFFTAIFFGIGILIGLGMVGLWFKCLIWSLTGDTQRRELRVAKYHAQAISAEAHRLQVDRTETGYFTATQLLKRGETPAGLS